MPEKIRVGGIGLVSMRERVVALGGEFEVAPAFNSESNPGLLIKVRLPLVNQDKDIAS
jgi:signal transduction histidine kinase